MPLGPGTPAGGGLPTDAKSAVGRSSPFGRVYGLGNVFAKSFRDSRVAMWIVAGFFSVMWVVSGQVLATTFGTIATRSGVARITETLPPILQGLFGGSQPNVATLGGFSNWRYGFLFFLIPGIWSLFALSSTLVNEAKRGSLDLVAGAPISRRRIALQKLGGHVAAMALAMLVTAVVIWLVGERFGRLSAEELAPLGATGGDAIPFSAALGYMLLLGLLGLAVGAVAFALAPFVGRGAAAGISGGLMAASWLVYGYRESISLFDRLLFLSPHAWTAGHRPVAGTYDWPALLPLVAVIVAGFAVGTIAFERRDLGSVGSVHLPRLPARLLGLRGPLGRSLSDRASLGLSWGIGIGAYAFIVANAGTALRDSLVDNPGLLGIIESVFPNVDVDAPGFALQLAFLVMGYLGTGLAAARVVNGWALDEAEGRLELVLATPMGRLRWFLGSAAGVFATLLLLVVVIAIGMGLGVASTGDGVLGPMLGAGTLLLYGSAVAGVGFAFGGLWRSEAAAIASLILVVVTLLLDIVVPALGLPDWVHDLALTGHFGQPLVGEWNLVGVGASLVLALGGVAVGTWGFSRRDLAG